MKRHASTQNDRFTKQKREQLFTLQQLTDIVTKAVAEREAQLKELYERMLQEQLQIQYAAFSQHNMDQHQIKRGDFTYLS